MPSRKKKKVEKETYKLSVQIQNTFGEEKHKKRIKVSYKDREQAEFFYVQYKKQGKCPERLYT